MNKQAFRIVENPGIRIPTIDAGKLKNKKTSMIGFLEVDITNLRMRIKELRKQRTYFSFTACMIKIVADCVAANKYVQAALINDRTLALFDEVDLSISIERKLNDIYFPFPLIIRSANRKTVLEIDQEIRTEVDRTITSEKDFLPEKAYWRILLNLFYRIPSKIRVLLMEYMLRSPVRAKGIVGTVGFATVTMAGQPSGWVFPDKNPYSLYIALGSVTKKPLVIKNEIVIRDVLNLTAIFDHSVIDGTPARKFMNSLVNVIEKGLIETGCS
jgi:pyruvate/2-oxoglutarate dehydrogenase complex dihydrolipoamide acyltransferase (E2) component